jgi:DNA-binding transcriptional LysR family regulator
LIITAPAGLPVGPQGRLRLYEERYVVVFNDLHRFNQLEKVDLAAVQAEPYLDRLNCELRETLRGICLNRQVDLYAAYRSNSEEWILSMVETGIGVALMPEHSVPRKSERLKWRYLSDPEICRTVYAIYPPALSGKVEVSALLDRLRVSF